MNAMKNLREIAWNLWGEIAQATGGYKSYLTAGEAATLDSEEIREINAAISAARSEIAKVEAKMAEARKRAC